MNKKYKKRTSNIDKDFKYYLSQEGLYTINYFGHKGSKKQHQKINYIWNALLHEHGLDQYHRKIK